MAELEKYSNSVKWVNIGKDWEKDIIGVYIKSSAFVLSFLYLRYAFFCSIYIKIYR